MDSVKQHLKVKLKGIVVKNIEGNRGKLGAQNIWKYRALKSDYFLFNYGHEIEMYTVEQGEKRDKRQ